MMSVSPEIKWYKVEYVFIYYIRMLYIEVSRFNFIIINYLCKYCMQIFILRPLFKLKFLIYLLTIAICCITASDLCERNHEWDWRDIFVKGGEGNVQKNQSLNNLLCASGYTSAMLIIIGLHY